MSEKIFQISVLALLSSITMATVPEAPCSSTSYVRGHPVQEWNYDLSTLPTQVRSWILSTAISAGEVLTQRTGSLSWLWRNTEIIRNRARLNGFLYGQVDAEGRFSGDNITFIYPDFLTGLRGTFKAGVLQNARAVDVVGERCNNGLKELKLEKSAHNQGVMWENTGSKLRQYGKNPRVMDPHERKAVYVGESTNPRAEQGLFARRKFSPGDLVSYYGGERVFLKDIVYPNMTAEEVATAMMYTLVLGENMEELLVDVSQKNANITEYRTTLGHKANHMFQGHNTVYQKGIDHPVLGRIGCIMAIQDIEPGQEIFTHYNYNPHTALLWYRQEYTRLYGQTDI